MKGAYRSPHPQSRMSAAGVDMAYVDTGAASHVPVVFLHGNPTSSYLWRNVIPHVAGRRRCLAPDLAGMGNSGPSPDERYGFFDHAAILDAWFDKVAPDGRLALVVHDWGSALGFHWTRRNPERVAAIAYMEAITRPFEWDDFPPGGDKLFARLRGEKGEQLVLEENYFVERVLPGSILRTLSQEEMEVYRAPYPTADSRRPTLAWPRNVPIAGEPADVVEAVEQYGAFLAASDLPKLFVCGDPGFLTVGRAGDFCRGWPNQRETRVKGIHFLQEDSAEQIGAAVAGFLDEVL